MVHRRTFQRIFPSTVSGMIQSAFSPHIINCNKAYSLLQERKQVFFREKLGVKKALQTKRNESCVTHSFLESVRDTVIPKSLFPIVIIALRKDLSAYKIVSP